jgi:hypothetical protein
MTRTKEELLLECIQQFDHMENILGFNRLSTTKSLINEINQTLHISDFREQLVGFLSWYIHESEFSKDTYSIKLIVDEYLKSINNK